MAKTTSRSRTRTSLNLALAAAFVAAGCGGGGSSGAGPTGASLAFTVNWEQRSTSGGLGQIATSSAAEPLAFDTPIPNSVNAIRFVMRPESGPACCVAVVRGSEAFEQRRIILANVAPGLGSLEVHGFPTDFAPSGGVGTTCPTREDTGTPCSGQRTLPSFGSDEIPVDVIPGETTVVDVDVHSLPFLLNLDPDDGETADANPPEISFTVVDANHDIDPESLDVHIQRLATGVDAEILDVEDCRDDDAELSDCSEGGALDVAGLHVTAVSPQVLPTGVADLTIRATNDAPTPRDMESETTFVIPAAGTTTTSTLETSTTTSTIESTTTTLGFPVDFCVRFVVTNAVDLVGISYNASYGATGGEFNGTGDQVECFTLLETNPNSTLATFNDNENTSVLSTAIVSAETFSGPIPVAECFFRQVPPLDLGAFSIQVTEATAPDLSPASATVVIEETQCPL